MRGGSQPNAGRKPRTRVSVHAKFTKQRRKRFLQALEDVPHVRQAAAMAGVCRQTVYTARERDPQFAADWDKALSVGLESARDELYRRAVEGVEVPVHYQGERVDTVKQYSDLLLMFLLKAHDPEKYRDNYDVRVNGSVHHTHSLTDPRETAKWLAFMLARGSHVPDPRLAEVKQLPKLGPEEWHKKADVPLEPATTETEPAQDSGVSIETYRGGAGER